MFSASWYSCPRTLTRPPDLEPHPPDPPNSCSHPVPLFLPHSTPVCQQLLFARPSAPGYLPPGSRRCPLIVPLSSPRGRWLFPWSWDEEGLGSCSSLALLSVPRLPSGGSFLLPRLLLVLPKPASCLISEATRCPLFCGACPVSCCVLDTLCVPFVLPGLTVVPETVTQVLPSVVSAVPFPASAQGSFPKLFS